MKRRGTLSIDDIGGSLILEQQSDHVSANEYFQETLEKIRLFLKNSMKGEHQNFNNLKKQIILNTLIHF